MPASTTGINSTITSNIYTNDSGLITGNILSAVLQDITAWSASSFPSATDVGAANGIATLDSSGRLPSTQLPVGITPQMAAITVIATNTLADLPTSCSGLCILFVRGIGEASSAASPYFTVSGTTLTWNETNAGYTLTTADEVVAFWMH